MGVLGLNTKVSTGINPELLTNTMLTDKKSSNTLIRLVLIKEIAKPFEHDGNYFYAFKKTIGTLIKAFIKSIKFKFLPIS